MVKSSGILYIEPEGDKSNEPIVDSITRKMTAALRQSRPTEYAYRGVHRCVCGAISTNVEHVLPNSEETNSLCVHYLAFHREDVPVFQLDKVDDLPYGEEDPTPEELSGSWGMTS